jgi:hypothetical protein
MPVPANPQIDLTTLAQVKLELGISNTTSDDFLQTLITAASEYIASWCSRQLVQATINEVRDGSGSRVLMFAEYPVTAVASVAISGTPVNPVTDFVSDGFRFTKTQLILNVQRFCRDAGNVALQYTAGYSPVPPDLAQAAAELVILKFKSIPKLGTVGSQAIDGQSISFNAGQDFTPSILTILKQYRKVIQVIGS